MTAKLILRKANKLNSIMVDDAINHECSIAEKIKRIEYIAHFNFKVFHPTIHRPQRQKRQGNLRGGYFIRE